MGPLGLNAVECGGSSCLLVIISGQDPCGFTGPFLLLKWPTFDAEVAYFYLITHYGQQVCEVVF